MGALLKFYKHNKENKKKENIFLLLRTELFFHNDYSARKTLLYFSWDRALPLMKVKVSFKIQVAFWEKKK